MDAVRPFTSSNRKIDPSRRRATQFLKPDGSPDNPDRIEIGPTELAFREWAELGIAAPNLERMRQTRLERTAAELRKRDLGGVLLFDPLNIRYACDSSNMHLWIAHNPSRAVFVSADGYMVLWDYKRCEHLSAHLPLIREIRSGAAMFYFVAGDKEDEIAAAFAAEVDDLMRVHAGRNRRIAIDKMELHGAFALQRLGLEIVSGQEVMEHARLIKSGDEINAMRCAIATCEIAMAEMEKECRPGIAETELWAILHAENIKRGGEWIETRILSSGPRTNPWFQEAGPRKLEAGDLLAFDTDLIGPYGMCCDMSRTWFVGDGEPSAEQKRIYRDAHDHIMSNMQLAEAGRHLLGADASGQAAAGGIPGAALRRDGAWRRAVRRVPVDLLSGGFHRGRLRLRTRAGNGAVRGGLLRRRRRPRRGQARGPGSGHGNRLREPVVLSLRRETAGIGAITRRWRYGCGRRSWLRRASCRRA